MWKRFGARPVALHAAPMSSAARALHARLFTLDTHIDTPTASLLRPGWDFSARHDVTVDASQCDLPRLREGGMDAMVFAAYVGQASRSPAGLALAHRFVVECLERTHEVLRTNAAECGLALTADDALRLKQEGRVAIFLSLENAYSLGRDPANVAVFHRLGVRMIGLTHMLNNDVADSSTDPRGPEWNGLSPLGREVVAECNRLGIVVDASHASDAALDDLMAYSRTPVILSHSDCRAVCDHPRNIDDGRLRALAAQGGVIQVNGLPISLVNAPGNRRTAATIEAMMPFADELPTAEVRAAESAACDRACAAHPNPRVTLDDFIAHVEHAANVAGHAHVGIGCDFDGGGGFAEGLRDVADYPRVTEALLERGWSESELAQLWGENTLRIFRAAERAMRSP